MINWEIISGGLLGAFFAILLSLALTKPKAKSTTTEVRENQMNESENSESQKIKKSIFSRWSIRLMLAGFALGYFAVIGKGISPFQHIGLVIGFGLPFAVIFGLMGFGIDLWKDKKRK